MSNLSRRRFLEDSMFATAAAVAASSVSNLLAEEQPKGSKSANERLSVAVVGVNGRGNSHLHAYGDPKKRQDTEITYICDADEAVGQRRAKEVAERQGRMPKVVQDMKEVFDDKSVDIVTTATPNHWHALCSIWAIQAGKDVYVEKPVSHNVSEGRRIVEAARKYKQICQAGTQCRSMPAMHGAMDYLKSGKLGELQLARGLCYKRRASIGPRGTYEVPSTVNYDLWSGPAPMAPLTRERFHYDWHWQWLCGNGDLGNQGIHQMDVCRWALGEKKICKGVFSYGGRLGYEDAGETANTQVIVCDYDKPLVFEVRGLETNGYRNAKVGVVFHCKEGYIVFGSYVGGVAFDLEGKQIAEFKGGTDDNHFDNFIQAVRSRNYKELNGDIEEGHVSSALCHLGNISYRLGKSMPLAEVKSRLEGEEALETYGRFVEHLADNKVPDTTPVFYGEKLAFDPEKEVFIGNDDANAMLTRYYRAPYIVPPAGKV